MGIFRDASAASVRAASHDGAFHARTRCQASASARLSISASVTGRQVTDYVSRQAGIDLSKVFQQYLTTTMIPVLEYRVDGRTLRDLR